MLKNRSKFILAGVIFEFVIFFNILETGFLIPSTVLLVAIITGSIGLYSHSQMLVRLNLFISLIYLVIGGVTSIMIIPFWIMICIGYIHQETNGVKNG